MMFTAAPVMPPPHIFFPRAPSATSLFNNQCYEPAPPAGVLTAVVVSVLIVGIPIVWISVPESCGAIVTKLQALAISILASCVGGLVISCAVAHPNPTAVNTLLVGTMLSGLLLFIESLKRRTGKSLRRFFREHNWIVDATYWIELSFWCVAFVCAYVPFRLVHSWSQWPELLFSGCMFVLMICGALSERGKLGPSGHIDPTAASDLEDRRAALREIWDTYEKNAYRGQSTWREEIQRLESEMDRADPPFSDKQRADCWKAIATDHSKIDKVRKIITDTTVKKLTLV